MHCIIGLGNPGDEYRHTRHNIGWMVLEAFVAACRLPSLVSSGNFTGLISEGVVDGVSVGVLLPTTYMNKSGSAALRYTRTHDIDPTALIVVHDDVDLPFGAIRISKGSGGGGHNGVQSIIDALGTTAYIRVRIGIAKKSIFGQAKRPRGEDLPTFVLGTFSLREQKALPLVCERATQAIRTILTEGVSVAMNRYN